MLLSPGENGPASLFKEVRVFKEVLQSRFGVIFLLRRLNITRASTERRKQCQNLAPGLVTMSGISLVFSRKILTGTGFYRCCAPGASAQSSGKKSVSHLFWPGELEENCWQISQRILMANSFREFFGLVFPWFWAPTASELRAEIIWTPCFSDLGKSKRGLSKQGLGPKGANQAKKASLGKCLRSPPPVAVRWT